MGMKVKYQKNKEGMRIYSESRILPSHFRKWFLSRLLEKYDLYEDLKGKMRSIDINIIDESSIFSEDEIIEYKKSFALDITDGYFSFDEYLDISKVVFSDIYVLIKGSYIDRSESLNSKVAIVSIEPDGDVDSIWIEVFDHNLEMWIIELINENSCIQL